MNSSRTAYATYFDFGYLPRALLLLDSIREHDNQSVVWILCLDEQTHQFLSREALPGVHLMKLDELENIHPELLDPKAERSRSEYIFTLGPTFLLEILRHRLHKDDLLVYLDADLYFFSHPNQAVDAMANSSVGIIEHRYSDSLSRKLSKYGRFNVGWVGFRNDASGRNVLEWWAERCLEWCSDTPEPGKYADQGYLDAFPDFDGVRILEDPGFNLAPWNTQRHRVNFDVSAGLQVDDRPLVFFHFHGVKETKRWFITSQLVYGSMASRTLIKRVYEPYLRGLERSKLHVEQSSPVVVLSKTNRGRGIRGALFRATLALNAIVSILSGNAIRKSIM